MRSILKSFGTAALLLLVAGLLTTCVTSVNANDVQTAGRSVEEFINPDGSFDIEAARSSGLEGSLDLDGFDVRLDPETGEPLLSPAGANSVASHPDDVYWSALGSGMNDFVYSLTIYNGDLIAGGYFTNAGGVAAYYVARWDGSAWDSLGSGMNGFVFSLTVYNGEVIAGGEFTTAGGVAAKRVARWDGSSWDSLGSGINGSVLSLTVYNGALIAGGDFWTAGGGCGRLYRLLGWFVMGFAWLWDE